MVCRPFPVGSACGQNSRDGLARLALLAGSLRVGQRVRAKQARKGRENFGRGWPPARAGPPTGKAFGDFWLQKLRQKKTNYLRS